MRKQVRDELAGNVFTNIFHFRFSLSFTHAALDDQDRMRRTRMNWFTPQKEIVFAYAN
jgi:hypothetical protein